MRKRSGGGRGSIATSIYGINGIVGLPGNSNWNIVFLAWTVSRWDRVSSRESSDINVPHYVNVASSIHSTSHCRWCCASYSYCAPLYNDIHMCVATAGDCDWTLIRSAQNRNPCVIVALRSSTHNDYPGILLAIANCHQQYCQ